MPESRDAGAAVNLQILRVGNQRVLVQGAPAVDTREVKKTDDSVPRLRCVRANTPAPSACGANRITKRSNAFARQLFSGDRNDTTSPAPPPGDKSEPAGPLVTSAVATRKPLPGGQRARGVSVSTWCRRGDGPGLRFGERVCQRGVRRHT